MPSSGFTFSLYVYTTVNNANNQLDLTIDDNAAQGRYYTQAQGLQTGWTDEGTNTSPGVYTDTGSYARFTGTESSSSLKVTFRYAGGAAPADGVGISGVQLVYEPIPEPSAMLMGALGLLGLANRRRRLLAHV